MSNAPEISLSRTVRLMIAPGQETIGSSDNSFASLVSTAKLGAFYEFILHCTGTPEERTGFVESIYEMDKAVQNALAPRISAALQNAGPSPNAILKDAMPGMAQHLKATLNRVDWLLSPTYRISMETTDMSSFLLAQQYQFAASHRLHNPEYDDKINREVFGKCCNPNGHGHNYRLEVEVRVPSDESKPGHGFSVMDLDSIVDQHVIEDYDHTYLNLDVDDFKDCNPTVENITLMCHKRLVKPLMDQGVHLHRVRLWETEKTCCTYPADS